LAPRCVEPAHAAQVLGEVALVDEIGKRRLGDERESYAIILQVLRKGKYVSNSFTHTFQHFMGFRGCPAVTASFAFATGPIWTAASLTTPHHRHIAAAQQHRNPQ
jgi:hypothetical protein